MTCNAGIDEGGCLGVALQVLARPVTLVTAAVASPLGRVLPPAPASLLDSCEVVSAACQWLATLVVVLYHVANEIKLRRAFLAQEAARFPEHQQLFVAWPLKSAKGLHLLLFAYLTPVLVFSLVWYWWLVLMQWVQVSWETAGDLPSVLRLPYVFL